jgi:DNA (cytosine-5)-methyltransferase 1
MKLVSKRQSVLNLQNTLSSNGINSKRIELMKLSQEALTKWSPSPEQASSKASYQVLDFFSGCGGMSLGFAALNKVIPSFRIVGGVDINATSLATFESNYGAPGIVTDVRSLTKRKNLDSLLEKFPSYEKNKPTILIGCAPCQGFSSHSKKNWDKKEDARNTLIGAFAKVATMISPECIVMENVPELLSKKYWNEFEAAKNIFEENGYIVKQAIYNCAEFGVPQERFRAIIIAMKKDFSLPESFIERTNFSTVKDAIGDLPPVEAGVYDPTDKMHRSAGHSDSTLETIKKIPLNGGSRPQGVGPKCLDKIKGFSDVYGRLTWDKPSITITHYARNPASGRFVHPTQTRGLTARESARLQSFPDGFKFEGKFDDIFRQIGEAVPPRFSTCIAASLFLELVLKNKSQVESDNLITAPVSNSYSSVIAGIKTSKNKGEIHV